MILNLTYTVNNEERNLEITKTFQNDDLVVEIIGGIVKLIPLKEIKLESNAIYIEHKFNKNDIVFVNGYQSWSISKEFKKGCKQKNLLHVPKKIINKFGIASYGDYSFNTYPNKKNYFQSYTYSYVRCNSEYFFIGSLNEHNAYLKITSDMDNNQIILSSDARIKIKSEFILFNYEIKEGNERVINDYFAEVGDKKEVKKLYGYTSWYNYYQDISEEKIIDNLKDIDSKDYGLFQIDDGFETYVGDWLNIDKKKFPNGLKKIVETIKAKGLMAGIWLAPFVAEEKSELFIKHPEYFLTVNGEKVKSGGNWSGHFVLDFSKQEVKEYIEKVLRYYMDLGFDFFKLDFLYAIAIYEGESKTRAMLMNEGMIFLRNILKDKIILGCGVPLSSAFNKVDYCRIGPDMSLSYDDKLYMRFLHNERPSTRNTISNTIYRRHMDSYVFGIDPDVFLVRKESNHLTKKQKLLLGIVDNLMGSLVLTSDNILTYNSDEKKLYEEILAYRNASYIWSDNKIIIKEYGSVKSFSVNVKKGAIKWIEVK